MKNFSEWLAARTEAVMSGPPDPAVSMAQQAVKSKLAKPDPKQSLAVQARTALGQAAANSADPMKIAKLDQPEDTGPTAAPGVATAPNAWGQK